MNLGPLLLWLVFFPLLAGLLCLVTPKRLTKSFALGAALFGLALNGIVYCEFQPLLTDTFQMVFSLPWILRWNIHFALGIDGVSLLLVLLTKFMMPIAVLSAWKETRHLKSFFLCLFLLDVTMTGTFLAVDLFTFYVFWEAMLVPMLLLIGIWGGAERIYASLKFFLFTFAGSIFMLVAVLWVFSAYHQQFGYYSADIASLSKLTFSPEPILWGLDAQDLLFLAFAIAFAIKIPLFPFHTWLPDAHVQAPTGGSILLAAVLLKMGTYGLLRFCIPICPGAFLKLAPYIAILSLVGIFYGAWVAFQQSDAKKLVAYSSVSHLGFIVLGMCALNTEALNGLFLQMINHGISTGALFFLVGVIYERRHSKKFEDLGGLASPMPWFAFWLVVSVCSSMAVPGLNGFVGEYLILLGTFLANKYWGALGALAVIFAAVYLLVFVRKILFGPTSSENAKLKDMDLTEWAAIVPLAVLMVFIGVAPNQMTKKIGPTLDSYWAKHISTKLSEATEKQGEQPS